MPVSNGADTLTVGLAQIAPVWLNREQTLAKIIEYVHTAAKADCNLVAFGEGLLPGYPFWIEPTGGAAFNSPALSSALRIAGDIVSTPVWSTSILMAPSSLFTEN